MALVCTIIVSYALLGTEPTYDTYFFFGILIFGWSLLVFVFVRGLFIERELDRDIIIKE